MIRHYHPRQRAAFTAVVPVLLAGMVLAGCTDNTPTAGGTAGAAAPGTITVTSTDTECKVSAAQAPSGTLTFKVTNSGSKVTEFYLLGGDALRIVAEVENIAPGLQRDLVTKAVPGEYFTACKPGMVGRGIRSKFTVTDSGRPESELGGADAEQLKTATAQYASYVKDQTEQLLAKTQQFVALYKTGKDAQARALYAPARVHWERIETVAESFGDLDPSMDIREADLEKGQKWTGWHRIEKDLWPPRSGYQKMTPAQRAEIADKLLADTKTLYARTRTLTYTVDQMANGSKGLLDEVATGKVTGEEEAWSHTDLWDFQANIDGAKVMYDGLKPLLLRKNAALAKQIDERFTALQQLLDSHRVGDGFKLYTQLSKAQVKQLSDAVNALSEPLSKLAAAVI